ncbi:MULTISPECIES: HNH endonuclease signature motif containing protein [Myxococcaceae]|uniref:HNH endonuclease signature motif containing protein n=1 Tax=Myxococcaceae TaxID=31 RepID=UPI0018907B92|nr:MULTISPECIES: HNH endonuclease signature motif containing protein [Myxococcaceae]MBF5043166.1 HNH endonuclease [Simulacricoccus sp. 17bor-14]
MAILLVSEGRAFLLDPSHDEQYPWVFDVSTKKPIEPLHLYVWRSHRGEIPDGYVVHHRDHNKLNATFKNLELLTREAHAARHHAEQQKFSPRVREDHWGLYRPHAPSPVRSLTLTETQRLFRRGKLKPPSATSRIKSERELQRTQEQRDEEYLLLQFERLRSETAHLDSGMPIPRVTTRRTGHDFKLGLGRHAERRGCTQQEKVLVYALAKHQLAEDVLAAVAADLGVSVELIRKMKTRPSVDVALGHWRKYRRLPKLERHARKKEPES